MFAKLRPRRSTTTEWSVTNPVLLEGELGVEVPDTGVGTGLCKFKLGDGYTQWNDLPYEFDAATALSIHGGGVSSSRDICLRTGSSDEWETEDPILKSGEIVFDITVNAIKCGDGRHKFTELDYIGYTWTMQEDYNFGDLDEEEPSPGDFDYDFGDIG